MATGQRRGRRIAMTPDELDQFLAEERTCRLATVRADRGPHVTPLWFVWDGTSMWLNSIVKSQRWADMNADPRVSAMVDAGDGFGELRGVELAGVAAPIGEVPRTGEQHLDELVEPERLWSEKYGSSFPRDHDGRHAWLRVTPERIVSWDFRKMQL